MAENFVMNYSNIELNRVVMHQNQQKVKGIKNADYVEPNSPQMGIRPPMHRQNEFMQSA